jgi:uncharacterized membrane protein
MIAELPDRPSPHDTFDVLSHFYRGEVGRIMVWRQRMDVTTTWAVGLNSALITSGYTQVANNHFVFVLAYFVTFLLLTIEARRFRHYHAYLFRVRMLEKHFIRPVLSGQHPDADPSAWREELCRDLATPAFKMSKCHAMFSRFRKTYYWIYLLLTISWITKIGADSQHPSWRGFVETLFRCQPFSEPLTYAMLAIVLGSLVWLVIGGFFFIPYSEEFQTPAIFPKSSVF